MRRRRPQWHAAGDGGNWASVRTKGSDLLSELTSGK
jgi:hypothetical protein